jgi:hypothetical protein
VYCFVTYDISYIAKDPFINISNIAYSMSCRGSRINGRNKRNERNNSNRSRYTLKILPHRKKLTRISRPTCSYDASSGIANPCSSSAKGKEHLKIMIQLRGSNQKQNSWKNQSYPSDKILQNLLVFQICDAQHARPISFHENHSLF